MLVVLAGATPARADDGVARYAEQTIAADAVALGLVLGGHSTEHGLARDTGIGLGIGGAPLVHLAHGNGRGAATSLALRVTLPLAAAWLGNKLAPHRVCFTPTDASQPVCEAERRMPSGTVVGLALGMAAVSVIDATTLAKKPTKRTGREWRPDLSFKNGGMRVSVAFKF